MLWNAGEYPVCLTSSEDGVLVEEGVEMRLSRINGIPLSCSTRVRGVMVNGFWAFFQAYLPVVLYLASRVCKKIVST